MKNLRIGYFADGPWAHNTLKKILTDRTIKVEFICVRNDKKDSVLMEMGRKRNIDVLWDANVNSLEFIDKMKKYNVDLFVSMSFNQIFSAEMINLPHLKTINCHAGKLPYYRGRNILNWVLINDEKEFGITVHYVDEGIDTGDIILQRSYTISDNDTYRTLLDRAYIGCADLLYDSLKVIQTNQVSAKKQNEIDAIGMYCGRRQVGDELIDWNQTSREIFNFVRAICIPGPRAVCYRNSDKILINRVHEVNGACNYKGIAGQVIGKGKNGVYVKTQDNIVEIIEYEIQGGNMRLKIGDRLTKEEKRNG